MIEQDFIMLIMNCVKYEKKALFQKRTWLKLIPPYLRYYHVIGDEKMETTYRFDEEKRILWVKTPDDYTSLPNKVITAYRAVNETFQFKYLFKTDDDQILVNPQFLDTTARPFWGVTAKRSPAKSNGSMRIFDAQRCKNTKGVVKKLI